MNTSTADTPAQSNQGQGVIPSATVEALGISSASTVDAGFGALKYSGPPVSLASFNVAALMRKARVREMIPVDTNPNASAQGILLW